MVSARAVSFLTLEEAKQYLNLLDSRPALKRATLQYLNCVEGRIPKKRNSRHVGALVRYKYGESMIANGHFCLPNSTDHNVRQQIASVLFGNNLDALAWPIPLGFVTGNAFEICRPAPEKGNVKMGTIPLGILDQGDLFGAFESIDAVALVPHVTSYSIVAGCISTAILAPLGQDGVADKLDKYCYEKYTSKRFLRWLDWKNKQMSVRDLIVGLGLEPDWSAEVFLMPPLCRQDRLVSDSSAFAVEVLKVAWAQSQYMRQTYFTDLTFFESVKTAVKGKAIADAAIFLKKLEAVSVGSLLGFTGLRAGDNTLGPLSSFADVLNTFCRRELNGKKAVFLVPKRYAINHPVMVPYMFHIEFPCRAIAEIKNISHTLDALAIERPEFHFLTEGHFYTVANRGKRTNTGGTKGDEDHIKLLNSIKKRLSSTILTELKPDEIWLGHEMLTGFFLFSKEQSS